MAYILTIIALIVIDQISKYLALNNLANIVTRMTKPDAIEPIIALEATVTGGRTRQAYKRGGENEARERL